MRHPLLAAALFATSLATVGCTAEEGDELQITCEGKCDGLSSVKALVADAKKLDLQDLINVGAGYATEGLNDALSAGNYASLRISPTELYAPASVAAGDLTLKNLDTLVSGLASKYGESALTTEVNKVRSEYLASSGKRVYAESAFKIAASLGHNWTLPTRGFGRDAGGAVTLGFDAGGELEARVITVHDRENAALVGAPLAAVKTARGFVLPRSLADIKNMAPGESFALAGRGRLGLNLGAGVPILIANPTSWLTYSLVLSAGMRSVLEGEMDVQLVHARGDQIVIDVGVRTATLKEAFIALTDGWGISGLVQSSFEIAGKSVDLGRLLDKALQTKIASKLSLIKARAERTSTTMRMSVARLRFDLSGPEPVGGREAALAQALKGDVRLAQALAARGDSGVVAEFDMTRSGASAISYAGVDVLGMSFYRRSAASEGSAVLQTPGGILALMWESLHRDAGWFFTSHGFTRIGVAGLKFDARTPGVAKSETNLMIQTEEGDKFMERDKVIDQLDSVIVSVGGMAALRAIERKGNELERLVLTRCPLPAQGGFFDESCNIAFTQSSEAIALKTAALGELETAIDALPAPSKDLLMALADLRISSQMIEDPNASAVGPTASVVVDFRLDDAALKGVFAKDGTAFKMAVLNLMDATQVERTAADVAAERTRIRSKSTAVAEKMATVFTDAKKQYERLVSIDGARIEGLGEIGGNAIEVRYAVDSSNRPVYDNAISQSVAQARAGVVSGMYDKLRAEADGMPSSGGSSAAHPEQIASFALLGLAAADKTELRVSLKTDNSSNPLLVGPRKRYDAAGFASVDLFAKGPAVSTIAAGLFDIDAIIDAPH
ncbi:MAG: hypothetical protein IPQ07_21260 [Myxococcales bacterium]|nr:hypothetical protein [Myxococcales bacterium]